jgi:altronate hydrolase
MSNPPELTDYALLLEPSDNVATALRALPGGEYITPAGETIDVPEDIPAAFKLAVRPIARGDEVRKYGHPIGVATTDIEPGQQVHVHNLASSVGGGSEAGR